MAKLEVFQTAEGYPAFSSSQFDALVNERVKRRVETEIEKLRWESRAKKRQMGQLQRKLDRALRENMDLRKSVARLTAKSERKKKKAKGRPAKSAA